LQRYSEGNPFLTTQILRTLLDDKLIQFNSGRWELRSRGDIQLPAAVAGLMERRLEKLSPDTRRILATGAVIGRVFDIDLACAAGAGTEDELLDAIDEATAHAVLEPVGTGATSYSFTHSLLVNAVASSANAQGVDDAQRATAVFHLAEVAEIEGKPADADRLCEEILEDLGERASAGQFLPLRRMRERVRALLGRPARETIEACQALLLEA